jgi:hypothetical protein
VHETSLDLSFIEEISQLSAPVRLPSSWTIRLDTHYLGGMRHWGSWEIADIGFLVLMRRGAKVLRSKIALLQSKRLYPVEEDYEEDKPIDYYRGYGRLWESDETFLRITQPREFHFREASRYKALVVADDQYRSIKEYEQKHKIPVHYLLYHPLRIPSSQRLPLANMRRRRRGAGVVGCRVVPAAALRKALAKQADGYSPSYGDLKFLLSSPFDAAPNEVGWRLEGFVSDLLIQCKEGYIPTGHDDSGVNLVFTQRGAPISAAISLTIEAPK